MPTPPAKRREPCQIGPLAIVAMAATVLLVVLALADGNRAARAAKSGASGAGAWSGFVGDERVQVAFGQRQIVVLKAQSLAERVAAAGGQVEDVQERRWTRQILSAQRQLIQRLALDGIVVQPDFNFARVLNGFAAALDPRAAALLERMPEVDGLYPVRAVYPASVPSRRGDERRPPDAGSLLSLPGMSGRGVTIALLDTGVDRVQPLLAGRVRPGFDLVDGDEAALAEARPGDPTDLERHGTELAGLLVADGERVRGIAPDASVLPLRVAGWQRDAGGEWAVYGRTDQLVAGLERAVDPNGDGDAHDAARIALVGVTEPFAAFADGPSATAATGASQLDTLVVVPAGNDGPAGPVFGSLAGPGASGAALTVGAADLRGSTTEVRVAVLAGLDTVFDGIAPVVGTTAPERRLTLGLARPAARRAAAGPSAGSPPATADFFGPDGKSRVAGRAALVPAGTSPGIGVANAVTAGAHAVLLHGGSVPAGALGVEESVAVPVIGLPRAAAEAALAALRRGVDVTVSIGAAEVREGSDAGRVAEFSSRGLAFDGRVKPELSAPGVALPTTEPGTNEDGSPRTGIVNGTSAAAATVAGAAALLAQARPPLDAAALKSALVGSARALPGEALAAQGAGLVDVGAAAAAELVLEPTSLAFDGLDHRATLVVRNVSTRPLVARIRAPGLTAAPSRVRVPRRGAVTVRLTAPAGRTATGTVDVVPTTGLAQRALWGVAAEAAAQVLLADARLSSKTLTPSDSAPVILSLQAGRVVRSRRGALELQPVSRLDIRLVDEEGEKLGLLARLRDVLPGRYAFGLTGRDPDGRVLRKGQYALRLVAFPVDAGAPTRRTLTFRVG